MFPNTKKNGGTIESGPEKNSGGEEKVIVFQPLTRETLLTYLVFQSKVLPLLQFLLLAREKML